MVARQQSTAGCSVRWLILLALLAGAVGLVMPAAGQDAGPAVQPAVATADREGAPPEPEGFVTPPEVAAVLSQPYPRSVEDLRAIEQQVARVLDKVVPATVGVQIGPAAGSGVIISPEGLVLTAGHVSGEPGRDALLILPDGRRVRGKTLGLNRRIDSGLMRITEEGPWPHVKMAELEEIEAGQWVVATGHPGGFNGERTPPVRLGRVLYANSDVICTDCTLVGGDSGGPLFNMNAEVIGIHSRIGRSLTSNFHVPIATYHDTWDRLVAGEVWGGRLPSDERGQVRPYLGMLVNGQNEGVLVTQVTPNTPAARAGVRKDDVILKFAGVDVVTREELIEQLWSTRPGERVEIEVKRGDENLRLRVVVGAAGQPLPGSPEFEPREPRQRPETPERRGRRGGRRQDPQAPPSRQEPQSPPDRRPSEQQPPEAPQSEPQADSADSARDSDRDEKSPAEERLGPAADRAAAGEESGKAASPHPAGPTAVERLADLGVELDAVAVRCVVARVTPGSAAEIAGLKAGDVLLSVGGSQTPELAGLDERVSEALSAEELPMTVRRNGREIELVVRSKPR